MPNFVELFAFFCLNYIQWCPPRSPWRARPHLCSWPCPLWAWSRTLWTDISRAGRTSRQSSSGGLPLADASTRSNTCRAKSPIWAGCSRPWGARERSPGSESGSGWTGTYRIRNHKGENEKFQKTRNACFVIITASGGPSWRPGCTDVRWFGTERTPPRSECCSGCIFYK